MLQKRCHSHLHLGSNDGTRGKMETQLVHSFDECAAKRKMSVVKARKNRVDIARRNLGLVSACAGVLFYLHQGISRVEPKAIAAWGEGVGKTFEYTGATHSI